MRAAPSSRWPGQRVVVPIAAPARPAERACRHARPPVPGRGRRPRRRRTRPTAVGVARVPRGRPSRPDEMQPPAHRDRIPWLPGPADAQVVGNGDDHDDHHHLPDVALQHPPAGHGFAGDEQRPRPRDLLEAEHRQADRGERQSWAWMNAPGGIAGERRDQGGRPHDQRVRCSRSPALVFAHGHGQSEHGREHDGQDQHASPPYRTRARNPRCRHARPLSLGRYDLGSVQTAGGHALRCGDDPGYVNSCRTADPFPSTVSGSPTHA